MKLLDRLRRPEWDHRDAQRRARAVASAEDAALLARIPEFARNDPDPAVRCSAVRRLRDLALLGDRMRHDGDAATRSAARTRLLQVLTDPGLATSAECLRVLAVEDDQDLLAHVAVHGADRAVRQLALERSARAGLRVERCQHDPDPALRLWLVERIDAVATLERIADATRRTDKHVSRAARERAQVLRLAAGDGATLQARAEAICTELDRLRRTQAPQAAARMQALSAEWQQLRVRLDHAMGMRVDGYFSALRDVLTPPQREPDPAPAAVSEAVTEAGVDARSAASAADADDAEQTPAPPPVQAASAGADAGALRELVERAEQSAAHIDARSLAQLRRRFATLADAALADGAEPELLPRFEAAVATAAERHAGVAAARLAASADADTALAQLEAALDTDQLAAARTAHAQLESARDRGASVPGARLAAAEAKLEQLAQWQQWANTKVRARLCDDLAALPAAGLHPDAVANRVRELQAEWARLDGAAAHPRRAETRPGGLEQRFRALCHRALKPTRAYFGKRDELRAQRGGEIEAVLVEADALLAAERPDPAALLRLRPRIAAALRALDTVDPRQRGTLGKRLRMVLDGCGAARQAHAEEAAAGKHKLLANLRRGLAHATLEAALAQIAQAQEAWQRLPRANAELERGLREELAQLIEPWHVQVQGQRDARAAATQAAQQETDAILGELRALGQDAEALRHADARVDALTARWRAATEAATPAAATPAREVRRDSRFGSGRDRERERPPRRAAAHPREREFDQAVAQVQQAQQQALRTRAQGALQQLALAEQLCAELEDAAAAGIAMPDAAAIAERWNALSLPADALASMHERYQRALHANPEQPLDAEYRAEVAAYAAQLAVQAEFLAGTSTPEPWRELRREWQVHRLAARMRGEAPADAAREARELLLAWSSLGPLEPAQRAGFRQRIESALSGIL